MIGAVQELCPRVEVLCPGACALYARGPARYFGGEDELAGKITEAVRPLGFGCRIGIADGLFAAWLAAGTGPSGTVVAPGRAAAFLAPYPVAVLCSPDQGNSAPGDPGLRGLLPRLGITTLGEFAALPAAAAVNRFGARGASAHRLASGLDPGPLATRLPPAEESGQIEFDPPARQSEPVVFAAKALAEQVHSRLAARGLSCVRIRVQALWADGRESTRLWRHEGQLSSLAVAERVRWQLSGGQLSGGQPGSKQPDSGQRGGGAPGLPGQPDCPVTGGGIRLLRLTPDQLVPATGRQLGLWGDAVISDRMARAAARVQAMLGHDAVTRPVLAGGRGPAEQVTLVPFGDIAAPALPADRPWPGRIPAPAPATVYPVPVPARVTDVSGTQVTVTGRARVSACPARLAVGDGPPVPVTSWAGPWPVAERWWDPSAARRQARFQLITEDGTAWLAIVRDGRWLIEACYD